MNTTEDGTIEKKEGTELLKRIQVEGSPFTVVEADGKYNVILGKWKIGKEHQREQDAIKDAKSITWSRIILLMQLMTEKQDE